jgi:hypothetical protein
MPWQAQSERGTLSTPVLNKIDFNFLGAQHLSANKAKWIEAQWNGKLI